MMALLLSAIYVHLEEHCREECDNFMSSVQLVKDPPRCHIAPSSSGPKLLILPLHLLPVSIMILTAQEKSHTLEWNYSRFIALQCHLAQCCFQLIIT